MDIKDLKLNTKIIEALVDLGYTEATPIQEKCIPLILEGKDVFGQSSTGSGKTAAFGLPIIEKLRPDNRVQVLILTPTRELCVQITEALRGFSKYLRLNIISVYGGVSLENQIKTIRTADIVVGTPGRILDHIKRGTIKFNSVKHLVLDEADRMFDMGFIQDVEDIIHETPKERQTLLFSATIPSTVHHIIKRHMNNPVNVKSSTHVDKSLLKQIYFQVKDYEKFSLLISLIKKNPSELTLVFCGTRRMVDIISRNLNLQGMKTMAIHGGLTQSRRSFALDSLKKENINVLVATDVAARGLDIKNVNFVYNYDVPKTSDEYIHRIGRTARAGMSGEAITLLSERDYENFSRVLSDRSLIIIKGVTPAFDKVDLVRAFESRSKSSNNFSRGFNRDSRSSSRNFSRGNDSSRGSRDRSDSNREHSWGNKSNNRSNRNSGKCNS